MYVNRVLIFLLVVSVLLAPAYQTWIEAGGAQWYRPFLLWTVAIAVAFIAHRARKTDDL